MGIGTTEPTKIVDALGVERIVDQIRPFTEQDADRLFWYVLIHLTFVVSALLMGVLDKIAFAAHRTNGVDKPHGGGQP